MGSVSSARSRERGPQLHQKEFQERDRILSHPYLRPVYRLTDSEQKSISAVNLPAVLREVESNERSQQTAKDIKLRLGNSN